MEHTFSAQKQCGHQKKLLNVIPKHNILYIKHRNKAKRQVRKKAVATAAKWEGYCPWAWPASERINHVTLENHSQFSMYLTAEKKHSESLI